MDTVSTTTVVAQAASTVGGLTISDITSMLMAAGSVVATVVGLASAIAAIWKKPDNSFLQHLHDTINYLALNVGNATNKS